MIGNGKFLQRIQADRCSLGMMHTYLPTYLDRR